MIFLVISFSSFVFLITMSCFSKIIINETAKKKQLRWIRGDAKYIDEELEKSFYQRFILPVWKKVIVGISKLSNDRGAGSAKAKERNTHLENELRLAGIHISVQEFSFLRIIGTTGILAVAFSAVLLLKFDIQIKLLIALFSLILIILVPRYFLKSRIKRRQVTIQNQLPNVLDVLCVSIEAGLSFDSSLLKVTERFKGPLIEEFAQVYREVQMGKPRRDALSSLTQRSNVEELRTFASAVVQSEQFGTPMKNVLRAQAQQLRVTRRQQAQEKGMKAPVKMTIPMVLFIFPVIFIILLGPTLINFMQ